MKQKAPRLNITHRRRKLADTLYKIYTLSKFTAVKNSIDSIYIRSLSTELSHITFTGAINHTILAQVYFTHQVTAFIEPTPYGIAFALGIPVFLFHAGSIGSKVRHRSDKRAVFTRCSLAKYSLHAHAPGTAICSIHRFAVAFIIQRKRSV